MTTCGIMYVCLGMYVSFGFFFFFKQNTAYEVRISDWSSDVCSSDLIGKTMLTCHIAWHLAEQGKRVVVLDLDKQCHSAGMLKAEFEQIGPVQSILDFAPGEEPPALACFKNTRKWSN